VASPLVTKALCFQMTYLVEADQFDAGVSITAKLNFTELNIIS
jgi:hypothetical protein